METLMGRLNELRLIARVAQMYHLEGKRQAEIAEIMHMSQATVSRMLKRAEQEDIVRTTIIPPAGTFAELEMALRERYTVTEAIVVDCSEDRDGAIMARIGEAAAHFLEVTLQQDEVVGVSSWSQTILRMVDNIHPLKNAKAKYIAQILGGMGDASVQTHATQLTARLARLTGGEPTVRAGLSVLVEQLAALPVDLSLTTNGSTLRSQARDFRAAGLGRMNISLDSLRADRFEELTRRDELPKVLDGIRAAVEAGFEPVKVNVVVVRGVNDDEIVDFARFGRDEGVTVRFIEFMPLDADHQWSHAQVMPSAEIVAAIDAVFPTEPVERGSEPAERHRYLDGQGEIGVIGTVTEPFCSSCDRVRLTADGQLRACLFATDETDLRALLRNGATDDDLAAAIAATVGSKWAGHGISNVTFTRPTRSMSEIGG